MTEYLKNVVEVQRAWGTQYLMQDEMLCDPGYEQDVIDFVTSKEWPEDMVSIDVGAHHGLWTSFLACYRPNGFVYAFEPFPLNCVYFINNVCRQGLLNFRLISCAVSGADGSTELAQLYAEDHKAWTTSFHISRRGGAPAGEVAMRKLDTIPGPIRVDFIKLDAEGEEVEVIRGARKLIQAHHPKFLIEIHECGGLRLCDVDANVKRLLEPQGYEVTKVPVGRYFLWAEYKK